MKTQQTTLLDFLATENVQFTIPVYQRVYSWTKTQCEELAEDIVRAGETSSTHFLSMTLYMDAEEADAAVDADGATVAGKIKHYDIIDGQQRLATTTIMLTALRDFLQNDAAQSESGETQNDAAQSESESAPDNEQLSCENLNKRYLTVSAQPKVSLIGPDKDTLDSLIFKTSAPARSSRRITDNYQFFMDFFAKDDFDINTFWKGVENLIIITARLDPGDKAQKIFEGLNTKGIPLTAADLIRNYLLVAQTREEQERLYTEYWQPMEIMFEDDILSSGSLKLNTGLRMWLTIRFKKMCISDRSRTYYYFKRYMETEYDGTVEELLDELRSFCYMWAENYKFNEGRAHCSKFAWAKNGRPLTVAERQVVAGMKAQARRAAKTAYDKEAHRQSSMSGNEMTSLLPSFHRGMI